MTNLAAVADRVHEMHRSIDVDEARVLVYAWAAHIDLPVPPEPQLAGHVEVSEDDAAYLVGVVLAANWV